MIFVQDPEINDFLEFAHLYMFANELSAGWEDEFVKAARHSGSTAWSGFKVGFAKSLLGQLSAQDFENSTGWDFDSEEEFREHLLKYWRLCYGDEDPTAVVDDVASGSEPQEPTS